MNINVGVYNQLRWEYEIAMSQLSELGLSLGQRVDHIKNLIEKNECKDAIYKDGIFICPRCGASVFPLSLYDGEYCIKCGQRVKWKSIIKAKK